MDRIEALLRNERDRYGREWRDRRWRVGAFASSIAALWIAMMVTAYRLAVGTGFRWVLFGGSSIGFVAFAASAVWVSQFRCPRCGNSFYQNAAGLHVGSRFCQSCGMRKDMVPSSIEEMQSFWVDQHADPFLIWKPHYKLGREWVAIAMVLMFPVWPIAAHFGTNDGAMGLWMLSSFIVFFGGIYSNLRNRIRYWLVMAVIAIIQVPLLRWFPSGNSVAIRGYLYGILIGELFLLDGASFARYKATPIFQEVERRPSRPPWCADCWIC